MPESNYNPNQTVEPQVASPDNTLSVRASPEDFGAQVGQATQKLGATGEEAAQQQTQINIQRQGMINESFIANAETGLNTRYGELEGQYKSLKGQAYLAAHGEYVSKLQQARQDALATLPNDAAKRGFNTLAARAEGFVIRDAGNYYGTQVKEADTQATSALQENLIQQASRYSIASDDKELGYVLGSVHDTASHLAMNQGWDLKTKEGQAVLSKYEDEAKDKIWSNAIKTLADDPEKGDPIAAVAALEHHKDVIPVSTYAKLSQQLTPQYRAVQAKTGAAVTIQGITDDYERDITTPKPVSTDQPKSNLADRILNQESGGSNTTNRGQIQPETWQKFHFPGEQIDDRKQNEAVTHRIVDKYTKDYNGDEARVAVAYFSGPGNVSPVGSATPYITDTKDKNGKSVSSYVQDITQGQTVIPGLPGQGNIPVYRTKAEYFEMNSAKLDQNARDWSQQHFPNDLRMADDVVARTQQYYHGVINEENAKKAADTELVRRTVFGEGNDGHLITNIAQLEQGAPEVKTAWERMQISNPLAAEALKRNVLTANAKGGKQLTYGTDFWKQYEDMTSRIGTDKPPKVEDYYHQVNPDLGRNSPVTNTGLGMLAKEIQYGQSSPEGAAFLHSEKVYFEKLRTDIVGGLHTENAQGEAIFQRAMISALPKIQSGRADGKSAGELFDAESPDYIGGANTYDARTQQQRVDAMVANQINKAPGGGTVGGMTKQPKIPYDTTPIKKEKDINKQRVMVKQALDRGDFTRDEAEKFLSDNKLGVPAPAAPTVLNVQ
jgi:hypothetical protein